MNRQHVRSALSAIPSKSALASRSRIQLFLLPSVDENRLAIVRIDAASSSSGLAVTGAGSLAEVIAGAPKTPRRARAGLFERGVRRLPLGDALAGDPFEGPTRSSPTADSFDDSSPSWAAGLLASLTCSNVRPPKSSSCASVSRKSLPEIA